MTNHATPAASYWGRPVRYTVALDGSAKLYATCDGATRTVTTLRSVTDKAAATTLANDLNRLSGLADLGHDGVGALRQLADQLAAGFGVPAGAFVNLDEPADDRVGMVLRLTQVLDLPAPDSATAHDPALWRAGPLLRLLAAAAAEPEATRRALTGELRTILAPLDGTVVRAEYEADGWYNIAAWVDDLDGDQLSTLLLVDDYGHDELCRELLDAWSAPGGLLEDHADRIEYDCDFRLLVNQADVVRRLAATRPDLLAQVYTDEVLDDLVDELPEIREAAELAATFLDRQPA